MVNAMLLPHQVVFMSMAVPLEILLFNVPPLVLAPLSPMLVIVIALAVFFPPRPFVSVHPKPVVKV